MMEAFIRADDFFLMEALATIMLSVLVAVGLVYIIRILRDIHRVSHRVDEETESVAKDLDSIRARVKKGGWKIARIMDIIAFINKLRKLKGRAGNKKEK